jgi:hypothetical protein
MKGIHKAIVVLLLLAIVGVSGYFADRSNHQVPQYDPELKQAAADKAAKTPPPPVRDLLQDVYLYQPKPRHVVTVGYYWTEDMMSGSMVLPHVFSRLAGPCQATNVQLQTQCLDVPPDARTNPGADKIPLGVYIDGKVVPGLSGNPLIGPLMSNSKKIVQQVTKGFRPSAPVHKTP